MLAQAIAACRGARSTSRELDATIAFAVFPALNELRNLEPGIWQAADGSHVRALRYSDTWRAAATLPPAGHWIDIEGGIVSVTGPEGFWTAQHQSLTIALCIASLKAKVAELRPQINLKR
ncbi:hypothetical protein AB433_02625 [Croceicoccus naphthovorans]|uniref:Uncharacterized protein n=2 Tax=Croceicoccus naphthovorans TaxID=1348774 RepID=A0A0G3XFI1_9SPHN|nr:hypothetical protein AB433_02625 [Croceicoccus naphthovorans]